MRRLIPTLLAAIVLSACAATGGDDPISDDDPPPNDPGSGTPRLPSWSSRTARSRAVPGSA